MRLGAASSMSHGDQELDPLLLPLGFTPPKYTSESRKQLHPCAPNPLDRKSILCPWETRAEDPQGWKPSG